MVRGIGMLPKSVPSHALRVHPHPRDGDCVQVLSRISLAESSLTSSESKLRSLFLPLAFLPFVFGPLPLFVSFNQQSLATTTHSKQLVFCPVV